MWREPIIEIFRFASLFKDQPCRNRIMANSYSHWKLFLMQCFALLRRRSQLGELTHCIAAACTNNTVHAWNARFITRFHSWSIKRTNKRQKRKSETTKNAIVNLLFQTKETRELLRDYRQEKTMPNKRLQQFSRRVLLLAVGSQHFVFTTRNTSSAVVQFYFGNCA